MNKDTICVKEDGPADDTGGVVRPIQPSTAYRYLDAEEQYYPRYFNIPNQQAVVRKLCELESAEDGVVFSSGMAAISTCLTALLRPADHVILLQGIYGGTNNFVTREFERIGIRYTFTGASVEEMEAAITDETRLIYVESPTNPLLTIVDLEAVGRLARKRGIQTVIDNTFASPINQNPIPLGLDVVVHSGTKYLGGHSDLASGAALASKALASRIRESAVDFGGSLNAIDCYLLERSLKTLSVRVERQTRNAGEIAEFLDGHPRVDRVHYPGLKTHPGHDVARRQMTGFGGMLSFELKESADAFQRRLRIVTPTLSLGGVESTICAPAITSHRKVPREERERLGITEGLLRLSVGIEAAEDLMADLEQALG